MPKTINDCTMEDILAVVNNNKIISCRLKEEETRIKIKLRTPQYLWTFYHDGVNNFNEFLKAIPAEKLKIISKTQKSTA